MQRKWRRESLDRVRCNWKIATSAGDAGEAAVFWLRRSKTTRSGSDDTILRTYFVLAVPHDSSHTRSEVCMLNRQFDTSYFRLLTRLLALGSHRLPAARPGRPAIQELYGRLDRRGMKKAAGGKTRQKLPDYCDVDMRHDANGQAVWPADSAAIDRARSFVAEW